MTDKTTEAGCTTPATGAVGALVDQGVRPLVARLSVLQVLLAAHYPEHHAAVHEAVQQIERWEAYRAEMIGFEQRFGTIARTFVECADWEHAARTAMKAEAMSWVRARMPPAA
jgi:hypothetical protein